jgi:hypothetical protein
MGIDDDMDEFFEKKRREGAGPISRKVHRREEKCTTHHHACDCREAKIRRLVEAARWIVYKTKMFRPLQPLEKLEKTLKEWKGEYE